MDSNRQPEEPLRGVNLGGWLVLEKWMTPSLFKGTNAIDEYTFMRTPGAREKLERHRKAFLEEKDFEWIAGSGLNAVRIPVGYWIFDGDDPYAPGVAYLDWAMEMSEKYSLKVLINLHAAKGSQNGHDHSGRVGEAQWYKNYDYRKETTRVLTRLAERYKDSPTFWGIELLNEPKVGVLKYFMLRWFYEETYRRLTAVARQGIRVVYSDGFIPLLFSGLLKPEPGYPSVMDIHWYQFGPIKLDDYFAKLGRRPAEIARLQRRQPVIIGEWSGMLSHQTLAGLTSEEKSVLQEKHINLQLSAYESAAGWFYWTYKTEARGIWNFRWLVDQGKIHLG